jgi:hypothetical protein
MDGGVASCFESAIPKMDTRARGSAELLVPSSISADRSLLCPVQRRQPRFREVLRPPGAAYWTIKKLTPVYGLTSPVSLPLFQGSRREA